MTSLSAFYARGDEFLSLLNKVKDSLESMANPYKEAHVGGPLFLEDKVALQLFEMLLTHNTQFIPGLKPAIGMCVGDFDQHEGKDFLYGRSSVAYTNIAYLHASRHLGELLDQWARVLPDVEKDLTSLLEFIAKDEPALIDSYKIGIENFYAYVGFSRTDLPTYSYLSNLKKVDWLYSGDGQYKPWARLVGKIIQQCKPFIGVAREMDKLRGVLECKGHLSNANKEYFTLSSPSSSGGASWFNHTGDDIISAIPGKNNLFFLAVHSKKGSSNMQGIGGGSATDRSITFVVPVTLLQKFQEVVDQHPELKSEWPRYAWEKSDTVDDIFKKTFAWWKLTNNVIKPKAKEILENAVNNMVLGMQLDMSSPDGKAYLRPVVTRTFADKNKDLLDQPRLLPLKASYENFYMQVGENISMFPSVFAEAKEAQASA